MIRILTIAFLLLPTSLAAESPSNTIAKPDLESLIALIRKARREQLYLIDEVSQSCERITSGLKQRSTVYFQTSRHEEANEIDLNGRGKLRFMPENSSIERCNIVGEVEFQITEYEASVWSSDYGTYCERVRIFPDCSHRCEGFADVSGKKLHIVSGLQPAKAMLMEVGINADCGE